MSPLVRTRTSSRSSPPEKMSLKDRFARAMRANLNDLLDRIDEFEDTGGFSDFIDPLREDLGLVRSFRR